jgi:hypothetical protein
MNNAKLKNYAPQARRDFIQAVTDRAAFYGLTAAKIEPVTAEGDVAIIAGRAFPASVVAKRKKLEDLIDRDGFNQTMEALAYTWFNRFVAIRFMELHGYLEHGYRVLSHPDPIKTIPEILELAEHVDMPGLSKEKVIDLKLDVNKESELYQMLLLAQCRALHSALPFLFEGIDDETELVLPENLLHSDSILRKLVAASDPEDWQEVEVLGWLYQFYISERKDQVMARKSAVPTEDIPAVTQLFTPHWIVRYLVENSLGRLWLLNRPGSRLRDHIPYYIEGEPETAFLKITKPEEIRLCDPAVGSGHMLTYAFDLLTLIYEEEGYAPTEIPALILRHNLHGLEICPRAAQLAELALVFKAREKSRRFFQPEHLVRPHIIELRDVRFAENELREYILALGLGDLFNQPMLKLLHQFEEAKNFGSLIQPCLDERAIVFVRRAVEAKDLGGQLFLRETHLKVLRVLEQADALTQRYHIVVANPPYMGSGAMNTNLKAFVAENFPEGKPDLYGAFILRNLRLLVPRGVLGMITIPNWLFISSFEELRHLLLDSCHIASLIQNGRGVWGGDFGSAAFVIGNWRNPEHRGNFRRLFRKQGEIQYNDEIEANFRNTHAFPVFHASAIDFREIPGIPIAFWASKKSVEAFQSGCVDDGFIAKKGMAIGDNARFLRSWSEVSFTHIGRHASSSEDTSAHKWFPCLHGGEFRKWYGNNSLVVNWQNNGREPKRCIVERTGDHWSRYIISTDFFFRGGVTWSAISASLLAARSYPSGFAFTSASMCAFENTGSTDYLILLLNSCVARYYLTILSPTVNYGIAEIKKIPTIKWGSSAEFKSQAEVVISIARADWDNFETSWDFRDQPLLRPGLKGATLEASWRNWEAQSTAAIRRMQDLETENNRLFIAAYGLDGELQPEVPEAQITLARAEARRDIAAFLSYAVGCMMGRYSLDRPGLILANAGDSLREFLAQVGRPQDQLTFAPDEDGIIPVLDGEWFEDDIVARTHDFLRATFGEATLEANLRFIEESLGKDLRKYFLTDFYKDHLQTYKKRPIYWFFSSGKERAFQALVYLHRYHEGTLSRMRTEYVIPLQGKIASRIDQLAGDIQKTTSTSHLKKMAKERDTLLKQRTEQQAFDEKLRRYADQRIQLDLDDGVKVNYGKFGDLLAEVKAVTGGIDK